MKTNQIILSESIVKAVLHAIIVPIVVGFIFSVLYAPSVAFYTILSWYLLVSLGYYVSETKQVTAMVYFKIIRYLVAPILGAYLFLIVIAFLIAKFY
jgi:hypothetical protein